MRNLCIKIAGGLARAAAWSVLILLGAWLTGRIANDSLGWSQYLFWLPTYMLLVAALALILTSALFARFSKGPQPGSRRVAGRTRRIGLLACALVFMFLLIFEWRAHRYLIAPRPDDLPGIPSIRVLAWNPAAAFVPEFTERVLSRDADVLAITNAPWQTDWSGVRSGLSPSYAVRYSRFTLVSRFPIRRWGGTQLNVTGTKARTFRWEGGGAVRLDKGEGMFVELAVPGWPDESFVVWMIDMPSDANLYRDRTMREAAATIASFRGPTFQRNNAGLDEPVPIQPGSEGFPASDLIIGDFNAPRGSRSMQRIAGPCVHVFDQVGRGPAATWPQSWPLLALDQAFVAPAIRMLRYDVIDLGAGSHRAQVMDLVRVPP